VLAAALSLSVACAGGGGGGCGCGGAGVQKRGGEAGSPIDRLSDDALREGWTLQADEDLSRLSRFLWSGLEEVSADGSRRAYSGKLTLVYGENVRESYPVDEGRVQVAPRPAQLAALARSKKLSVLWKGHPPGERDFSWLVAVGAPEILEADAQPAMTRGLLRNPSLQPLRVELRAGWRIGAKWVEGDEGPGALPTLAALPAALPLPASARQELLLEPGETRAFELAYGSPPPDSGAALSQPVARGLR
jgi:hypothetical protein